MTLSPPNGSRLGDPPGRKEELVERVAGSLVVGYGLAIEVKALDTATEVKIHPVTVRVALDVVERLPVPQSLGEMRPVVRDFAFVAEQGYGAVRVDLADSADGGVARHASADYHVLIVHGLPLAATPIMDEIAALRPCLFELLLLLDSPIDEVRRHFLVPVEAHGEGAPALGL